MTTLTVFGMSGAGSIICLVLRFQNKRAWANGGQKYRAYLRKHKREVYSTFQSKGTLDEHIAEIDQQAKEMFERPVEQIAMRQGITERLKAVDQMAWVRAVNHVRSIAEEIVLRDLIYCQGISIWGIRLSKMAVSKWLKKHHQKLRGSVT